MNRRAKGSMTLIFLCLLSILMTLVPTVVLASTSNRIDYVSLGDSLAAGRTPYKTMDKSYTDYIAARLAEENLLGTYSNYGVSGYTSANILADISNSANTQLQNDLANADIITLDAGANDLMDALFNEDMTVKTDPTIVTDTITKVGLNMYSILYQLRTKYPQAKIYVMGYYNAFPHVPSEQQAQMVQVIEGLNSVIQNISTLLGATYVPTQATMAKDYEKYLPNPRDIHPSLFGYKAIAKEFWSFIRLGLPD